MATKNKDGAQRVTAYLDTLPEWSGAICKELRRIILKADPSLTEEWKWGPHYSSQGMVCGYGAFQKHVKLTFFNGSGMKDSKGLFNHCVDNEFSRSIKYEAESEINEKLLTEYIKESVAVNQKGFKREIKADLQAALAKNNKALAFFEGLSYGYKKDFVELVTTAKQEKTRLERIAKVVDHCAQGVKLNDKYKKATV
jgi:hypothetical protein